MSQSGLIWIEERDVFGADTGALRDALYAAGGELVWLDERWRRDDGAWILPERITQARRLFFHTSLGVASELATQQIPGVWCDVDAFACHTWYADFARDLVHQQSWHATSALALTEMSPAHLDELIGPGTHCFVRPDSPLKPFAGRVIARDALTLAALDHGFYYEDEHLPVIVAACRDVGEEWRVVVVDGEVVTASGYDAATRSAALLEEEGEAIDFATDVLARYDVSRFGPGCALDVTRVDGTWRIMEFNPLSGASLYGCDLERLLIALHELT